MAVPQKLWSKEYAAIRRSLIDANRAFREIPPYGDPESNKAVGGSLVEMVSKYRPAGRKGDGHHICLRRRFEGQPVFPDPERRRVHLSHGARLRHHPWRKTHPVPAYSGASGRPGARKAPYYHSDTGGSAQRRCSLHGPRNPRRGPTDPVHTAGVPEPDRIRDERPRGHRCPPVRQLQLSGLVFPHEYYPGRICLESRIAQQTLECLRQRGREVRHWGAWADKTGAVDAVVFDSETGTIHAGADPRRDAFPLGWSGIVPPGGRGNKIVQTDLF